MHDSHAAASDGAARSTRRALRRMLEPRSVAVVGASAATGLVRRADGDRGAAQSFRADECTWCQPAVHRCGAALRAVPRRRRRAGRPGAARRAGPRPGRTGHGSRPPAATAVAVVFGSAQSASRDWLRSPPPRGMQLVRRRLHGLRQPRRGVRAVGYLERDRLPPGPIALVTHSGSVFSAMLRTHRRAGVLPGRLLGAGAGHHEPPTTSTTRSRPTRDPGGRAVRWRPCGTRPGCGARSPGRPTPTSPSSR